MTSVATTLRAVNIARVLDMPVAERIALALAIGDDDLDLLQALPFFMRQRWAALR
jgi:hypothetical protein